MTKIFLNDEFDKIWNKIESGENFALFRYGDGERAIMMGKAIKAQEGWQAPNEITPLGKALLETLDMEGDNLYHGISCPCCDAPAYYWYSSRIKNKNRTFSNLWVNSNYPKFRDKFPTLKRDTILIANHKAKGCEIANLNIIKHYEIGDSCVDFYEKDFNNLINEIKKDFGDKDNLFYAVSAGPLAEPIIAELYKNNPNNCYIDFGSSLDIYYHENFTRLYMKKGSKTAVKNCHMENPQTANFDVSVVLNVYKKPIEILEKQLKALQNQTLKPKEILLYQDGTLDELTIPDSILSQCDVIELCPENKGVWARFDFANRKATCKYVCVFDDDTIPEERWLENCHTEMLKQDGLYGTIGIVMEEPLNYPNSDFYRVGWAGNYHESVEVDFCGHSWFLKQEWLKYLSNAPQEVQAFKKAGEDASLSFVLQQQGIKTFVPPHPKDHIEMFGSNPKTAISFGSHKNSISVDKSNNVTRIKVTEILLENGWKPLITRNKAYAKDLYNKILKYNSDFEFNFLNIIKANSTFTHKNIYIFGIKISIRKRY